MASAAQPVSRLVAGQVSTTIVTSDFYDQSDFSRPPDLLDPDEFAENLPLQNGERWQAAALWDDNRIWSV